MNLQSWCVLALVAVVVVVILWRLHRGSGHGNCCDGGGDCQSCGLKK